MRILLADDHPVVRRGLREILLEEFSRAFIGEASDGETLIKKVISDDWDIVICDLVMPGRNGVEATEQIKRLKPKLPVLIISIHSEEHYALRALKAGAAGYLKKDLAPEELIIAVHKVLDGKRYITPAVAEKMASRFVDDLDQEPHYLLSVRELQVFNMIASGKSISEIAIGLSLSTSAISTYRSRILLKMKLKTNADLTIYATKKGLL